MDIHLCRPVILKLYRFSLHKPLRNQIAEFSNTAPPKLPFFANFPFSQKTEFSKKSLRSLVQFRTDSAVQVGESFIPINPQCFDILKLRFKNNELIINSYGKNESLF